VASKKTKRAITAAEVPRVFDDDCIDRLAEIARLPKGADRQRFADGIREATRIYAEDARKPSINTVHDEIERLHQAAARVVLQLHKPSADDYERVADLIEVLEVRSPEVHCKLKAREATPGFERAKPGGLKFPSPEDLRDPDQRHEACDVVRRFCSMGIGPRRKPLLYAPERIARLPRREAELRFIMNLRVVWLEATGEAASATVNPARAGPFARFVRRRRADQ
jgi:hypothetical protein